MHGRRGRTILAIVLAVVAAAIVLYGLFGPGNGKSTTAQAAAKPPATVVLNFGNPGPGACVPGYEMLKKLGTPPYTAKQLSKLRTEWIGWIKVHETKPCVITMAKSLDLKSVKTGKAFVAWLKKNMRISSKDEVRTFINSEYVITKAHGKKVATIEQIGVQAFPPYEPLVQGPHGVIYFKIACGNRLYRAPATTPAGKQKSPRKTTPPGHAQRPSCHTGSCAPSPRPRPSCSVCTSPNPIPVQSHNPVPKPSGSPPGTAPAPPPSSPPPGPTPTTSPGCGNKACGNPTPQPSGPPKPP
ncbi:MAG TPA: hypothetical protein VMS08_02025 [Candidatus Saccharimonadia bacterium]|nr:hypothetical protein [Candidatus Saccharimonadia bacterium]